MTNTMHHNQLDSIVRANCTKCGAEMRLFGIEPHPTRDVDLMTYECTRCDRVQTEDLPRLH